MSTWPDGGIPAGWTTYGNRPFAYTSATGRTTLGSLFTSVANLQSGYLQGPTIELPAGGTFKIAVRRTAASDSIRREKILARSSLDGTEVVGLDLTGPTHDWTLVQMAVPAGNWYLEASLISNGSQTASTTTIWVDDYEVIQGGGPPPSENIDLPLVITQEQINIDLPLVVTRASTAQTLELPLRVTVAAPAALELPLSVRVIDAAATAGLNGAGGWPAAPGGRWQPVVTLDGADISPQLVGPVTINQAANEASTAEFGFRPVATLAPMALIGRRVRVSFVEIVGGAPVNAQTMFSGVVETPSVDLATGVIACVCHDQLQEILTNTPRAAIDSAVGGRWHVAVSGEPADTREYLEARIASVPKSFALDALQNFRVIPWSGAGLRAVTVRTADMLDGSLSIDLPSRESMRTRIKVRMQYRYTRLRRRSAILQWDGGMGLFLPTTGPVTSYPGAAWPTVGMVEGACNGSTGWELQAPVAITNPPAGSWQIGTTPADGFYTISPATAINLVLSFKAYYTTRWQQTATEDYTVDVVSPALETLVGQPVAEEIGATLQAEFDQAGWDADQTIGPWPIGQRAILSSGPPPLRVGDHIDDYKPAGADDAARDEVLLTLLDQAWVKLWAGSRTGRVRFDLPLRPDAWLDWHVTLDTVKLQAAGAVAALTHTLDAESGQAVTAVELAVGLPGATTAAQPTWTLPPPPVPTFVTPISAFSYECGTFVGGSPLSVPFDDDEMIGFATNLNGPEDDALEYYPHQLSIRSPDIDPEDRDALELTSVTEIAVTIPTDLLELV